MQTELRYEDREVLEGFEKIIEKDFISITTESTTFTKRKRLENIQKSDILNELKLLKASCKDRQCKLKGQNKVANKLKEIYPIYEKEYIEYSKVFDELCSLWKDHDLRFGYSEDSFYENELQAREFKLQKMNYGSTVLFQIKNMFDTLQRYNKELQFTDYSLIDITYLGN